MKQRPRGHGERLGSRTIRQSPTHYLPKYLLTYFSVHDGKYEKFSKEMGRLSKERYLPYKRGFIWSSHTVIGLRLPSFGKKFFFKDEKGVSLFSRKQWIL